MNIQWDSQKYTADFSFVHEYGSGVMDLIDAENAKSVLDLDCGNGALSKALADKGFIVKGLDASEDLLNTACPIRAAEAHDLAQIVAIVRRTVNEIYPKYYPKGAVEFFLNHHSPEAIAADIADGCVFAAAYDGALAGTVTVKNSEILRLFVLPEYQGKGIGGALLDFAEHLIVKQHSAATLAASLPAKDFYHKRGYQETYFHQMTTPSGDVLCYNTMEKLLYQTVPW